MDEDALKMYFDTEINHILDKIKGIKTNPEGKYRDTLNPENGEIEGNDIDKIKGEVSPKEISGIKMIKSKKKTKTTKEI